MADDKRTALISINIDNGAAIKKVADLSRKIEENKQHVKDLRKAIKELDETSDNYAEQVQAINEEIAATNAQSTEYKRTVSDLNRVLANSVRESISNEGAIKSLRAELSRLTDEYDSLSESQRMSVRGDELQKQIATINEKIKGGEEATGRFYRNVGSYEEAIKNALGLNQGFAGSIMGIAEGMGGMGGIIPGLKSGINGLNGALKATLANPIMLAIFGVTKIAEGLKFWFDYNKGLSEATRLTEQFTGLTGDELISYRDNVQAVADVYGKEFTDVLQSANALSKQFGITNEEAIEIIKDGFVSGADVSGNFLDTVKEYPAFFREAGLSASEFVAISTEAVKQGVFSDKGVDAIKEATIRLREMSTSTSEALAGIGLSGEEIQQAMSDGSMTAFDAIQKVSEKLNELPETSSAVGTAVADIFGGAGEDAGLQYLKTLKDISTDLDEVKNKAGEYATLQDDYLNSQVELQSATNRLFGSFSTSFDDVMTKAKTFLNNVLTGLINGVLDFGARTGATFSAIKVYVSEAMDAFSALGELLKAVVTLQFGDVSQAWDKWINEVKDAGGKAGEAYTKAYNDAVAKTAKTSVNSTPTTAGTGVVLPVSTPTKSTNKEADKAREKALQDLAKYEEELNKIIRENNGTQIDQINARYDAEVDELRKSLEAHRQYSDDIQALEANTNEAIRLLNEKRNAEIAEANRVASEEYAKQKADEYARMQSDEAYNRATELMQLQLYGATERELLEAEERQLNEMLANMRREDYASEAEFENAKTSLMLSASEIRSEIEAEEIERAELLRDSATSVFSAIGELIQATSSDEEEAAKRGKVLALAEIAFSTGVAIAEGVSSAMAVPFPANLAAIATTIATVISNMASAITTVNSAKFAEGGLVTGEGTGTSDSIPAMLSNGESVMTARTTAMFAPVLSAFNQMGGGVPIGLAYGGTSMGEEMLARAFARGASALPNPVVGVQEITRVANRVQVLEDIANV